MTSGKLWKRLIAATLSAAMVAVAAGTSAAPVYARALPFMPGERITYDVVGQIKEWRMKGPLGSIELLLVGHEIFKGKRVLHARATASSSLLLKTRFERKDVFHTWFDPGSFQTHRIEKITREGAHTRHVIYEIDPQTGAVAEYDRSVGKVNKYGIPLNAHDFVSFLYWFRSARKEQTFAFTLFDGEWKKQYTAALTPGEDVSVPLLDRKNKLKTLVIKQSAPHDLTVRFAKDFNYIPIEMGVMNVQARDVHVSARGILSGYTSGK